MNLVRLDVTVMPDIIEPTTARHKLRQWQQRDLPLFASLNADPVVMKYFLQTLSVDDSNALAERLQALIAQRGWGLWAVERVALSEFFGFVGLHATKAAIPCAPCIEVGWRLAKQYWDKGYASEAATAALEVAFNNLHCQEVFSFTALVNLKSQALMQRLHMVDTGQNFEHPDVPKGHHLREHVLYKLTRGRWEQHAGYQLHKNSYRHVKVILQ